MTARGFYTLLFGALMLFTALSVGSAGAFLLGTAALLCWALSLLCVCAAALSCRAEQQLEGGQTQRGGTCRLILRVRRKHRATEPDSTPAPGAVVPDAAAPAPEAAKPDDHTAETK